MAAPTISAPILWFLRRVARRRFRKHFHGVRICGDVSVVPGAGPLIIFANHSSWWDPMLAILLAQKFMPERPHYAPMDAVALARYGILRKVGIFPVELETVRGAVQFLRTGASILKSGGVLWVTPQGRFVDPRAVPLDFKPGLAALARRVSSELGSCTLLPLAIEYPFWDERLPEVLLRFGEPVRVSAGETAEAIQIRLLAALYGTMVKLQESAVRRDPLIFRTILRGASGAGGFYAVGQRLKASIQRRPYRPEHTAEQEDALRTEQE
jgi:1-acyl-sn-glycerol-3-phosphate acyltransferase